MENLEGIIKYSNEIQEQHDKCQFYHESDYEISSEFVLIWQAIVIIAIEVKEIKERLVK